MHVTNLKQSETIVRCHNRKWDFFPHYYFNLLGRFFFVLDWIIEFLGGNERCVFLFLKFESKHRKVIVRNLLCKMCTSATISNFWTIDKTKLYTCTNSTSVIIYLLIKLLRQQINKCKFPWWQTYATCEKCDAFPCLWKSKSDINHSVPLTNMEKKWAIKVQLFPAWCSANAIVTFDA